MEIFFFDKSGASFFEPDLLEGLRRIGNLTGMQAETDRSNEYSAE